MSADPQPAPDPKPPILVVEDENVVAMDLVASLERLGYTAAGVAVSGEEAVALARDLRPGLVLMDIHLRGSVDGVAASRQIQDELSIPVVYLTAYSDPATLERARVTHPFGYVLKPFEDREIEVAIQIALFRHQMERALREREGRLDAILSGIGDAVIATDVGRRVTFLNRSAQRLLGWSAERARGRLLSDVLKVSSSGEPPLRLNRGSSIVPVELIESPVTDASGDPTGYVTVVHDLSEQIRAQEAHDRELIERAARAAAEREHARAHLKSEISFALADITESPEQAPVVQRVADLIVASFATWCVIFVDYGDDGEAALAVAAQADAERTVGAEELLLSDGADGGPPLGIHAVLRTRRPQLLATVPDEILARLAADERRREAFREAGVESYIGVPLRARQRVVGALSLASSSARGRYDETDLAFAQQVADRIALGMDNARLFHESRDATVAAERMYEAEQRARMEAEALFRIADALAETQLDLEALIQRVTDEARILVGAEFGAFFYNVVDDRGETYMLYTLSGAPREAFDKFGMPRNTPLFGSTFAGEAVVRIDDVLEDPRYGRMAPHHGMPEGHLPVRSYLAVPVVSPSGTVIGGLFFGHPEPGRFTHHHERTAKALAAHAAAGIDNAHLFAATREAEERQSRLVQQLERTVRFSEVFIGILGHDLRNPLSGITTAASLILAREDSDRVAAPVRRILNSADRMRRMIDQILDFTHVRLGSGIPLKRKDLDLAELCRMVLDELKSAALEGGEIRLEVEGDAVGRWDEDRLAQLISNLAGNAIQHRRAGSAVLLRVEASRPDRVMLEVRNEGEIPPEVLPVLFEPLRPGEHRKLEGSSGLGLGLYISQQIAVAHGGSIRVQSTAGSTRFTVDLPRFAPKEGEQVFGDDERGARRGG